MRWCEVMKMINPDFMIMTDDSDENEISLTIIISNTNQKQRGEFASLAKQKIKQMDGDATKDNVSGHRNNKNAVKPDDDKYDAFIHARCYQADKSTWMKVASEKKMSLTKWIVTTLNAATKTQVK